MAKFTNDDVDEIVTALQRERGQFAFLMGAGCSLTAGIPGGGKIATDICEQFPHQTSNLSKKDKENYAICMARLPIETRKKLINDYLSSPKVKLNWAHIALASLVKQEYFSRVLTFNFDNLLTRACGLLGIYPATYDFGIAPSTHTRHLAKPSIVHLHGQGSGSVLLNTDKETERHAEALEPLLKDTFANYPMLVLGYSGESDKVFHKIKTLYKGEQCLYWIGHDDKPGDNLAQFIGEIDGSGYCKYIGGADADELLIKLAQKLNCFPPAVFTDPAGNLLLEMEKITDFPLDKTNFTTDILKKSRSKLSDIDTRNTLRLDGVDLAVLSNKPEDVPKSGEVGFDDIPPEVSVWALIEQGNEYYDAAKNANSASEYENAARQYEAALKIKPNMHEALINLGVTLSDLAVLKQDPALLDSSISKFEAAHKIDPCKYEILNSWGEALSRLANLKQDPTLYDACFTKFMAALEDKPDDYVALFNWGTALTRLAQLKKDVNLYESSFLKYEASVKLKPDMHKALNNWGAALTYVWRLSKDKKHIEQATIVLGKAEKLNPDECYNGACLAAITNDEAGCKERLFKSKAAKTLPSRQVLENDEDLANMRDKPWFVELLKDL